MAAEQKCIHQITKVPILPLSSSSSSKTPDNNMDDNDYFLEPQVSKVWMDKQQQLQLQHQHSSSSSTTAAAANIDDWWSNLARRALPCNRPMLQCNWKKLLLASSGLTVIVVIMLVVVSWWW